MTDWLKSRLAAANDAAKSPDCRLCGGVGSRCGDDTCCPCRCVLVLN